MEENQTTDIVETIAENAEKEFSEFKAEELLKDKETIFGDSHKINKVEQD